MDALQRIEHNIRERRDTVTDQLKGAQMNFMIEVEQGRATQDTYSDSDRGTVRPLRDLSSLPRYIDHDGDTVRGTSSDGMSYAGTVVRGGPDHLRRVNRIKPHRSNYPFNEPSAGSWLSVSASLGEHWDDCRMDAG